MSLKPQQNFALTLVGAAIAVLLAIPLAALIGSFAGDSYTSRATAYILVLSWAVAGAISLIFVVGKSTKKPNGRTFLIWILSVWIWPFLLLTYFGRKKNNS